jgi:hypothetical protein
MNVGCLIAARSTRRQTLASLLTHLFVDENPHGSMQGEQNNRPCPSFEGYKPLHRTRRKGGDEPPHHGRNSSCSYHRPGYRGRLWGFPRRAAASHEPDTPVNQG